MAFMDQFRFGGQNDLLQMPNQGNFGMMQSPFGQQQPQQQYGFGMFQSPWQQNGGGYNPQPGNMGFNQTPVQNPSFQQPQNPTQNPNIGHNNPRFQVQNRGMFPPMGGGQPGFGQPPSSMQPTWEDYTMDNGTVRKSQVPTMFNGKRYMRDMASGQWNDMDDGMAHATGF